MVNLTETTGGKAHLSQSCNPSWGNVFLSVLKCPTSLVPLQLCHQCHPCSLPTRGYGELDAFIPPGLSMPPCMLLVQNCAGIMDQPHTHTSNPSFHFVEQYWWAVSVLPFSGRCSARSSALDVHQLCSHSCAITTSLCTPWVLGIFSPEDRSKSTAKQNMETVHSLDTEDLAPTFYLLLCSCWCELLANNSPNA